MTPRPHRLLVAAALVAAGASLRAQPPAPAATTPEQNVTEGDALLAALIAAQKDMAQLTADYVQYRTTKLFKKPLRSEGKLAFRRDPGCVVFVVTSPRASVVRLDTKTYEVWHPDSKRLERFVLPSEEMPRLLFDSLAPTRARLEGGFAVETCAKVDDTPTRRLLTLVPTDKKTRRVASRITLLLDVEGPKLCGFGYQDPRGDDVRIELSNLVRAEKADATLFTLDLPADAKITEQIVPAPAESPAESPVEAPGKAPSKAAGDKKGDEQPAPATRDRRRGA